MRCPSSTPAGMRTLTSRGRTSPRCPLQVGQPSLMIWPLPPQRGHTSDTENGPWFLAIMPTPPHSVHVSGMVPGFAPEPPHVEHTASAVKLTVVVTPCTASRKSRCNSASRSRPRRGPRGALRPARRLAPRPNRLPSRSPKPPNALELDRLAVPRATGPTEAAEPAGAAESARSADTRRDHLADVVVLLALRGIAEDVVRTRDFLEALLGCRVSLVRVRVVLLRQLAIGAGDLLLGRVLRHAEHPVVVLFEPLALRCHWSSFTLRLSPSQDAARVPSAGSRCA